MADMTINATNYPALSDGERAPRKYGAHAVDANFGVGTKEWYRLGDDLEEFNVELNPDTEVVKNILGNSSFRHNGYEPTADAEPFYAKVGDKLFEKLQHAVDILATGDALKTTALEVHMWKTATVESATYYEATTQDCYIVPTSHGGDTSGYQIPFTVNYAGEKTTGAFNASTKAFVAGEWTESGGSWSFTPST